MRNAINCRLYDKILFLQACFKLAIAIEFKAENVKIKQQKIIQTKKFRSRYNYIF